MQLGRAGHVDRRDRTARGFDLFPFGADRRAARQQRGPQRALHLFGEQALSRRAVRSQPSRMVPPSALANATRVSASFSAFGSGMYSVFGPTGPSLEVFSCTNSVIVFRPQGGDRASSLLLVFRLVGLGVADASTG